MQKQANQNRTMLKYRTPWFGSRIIAVNPEETSRSCSACDSIDAASRVSQSRFVAPTAEASSMPASMMRNILKLCIGPTGELPRMACGEPVYRPEAGRRRPRRLSTVLQRRRRSRKSVKFELLTNH